MIWCASVHMCIGVLVFNWEKTSPRFSDMLSNEDENEKKITVQSAGQVTGLSKALLDI